VTITMPRNRTQDPRREPDIRLELRRVDVPRTGRRRARPRQRHCQRQPKARRSGRGGSSSSRGARRAGQKRGIGLSQGLPRGEPLQRTRHASNQLRSQLKPVRSDVRNEEIARGVNQAANYNIVLDDVTRRHGERRETGLESVNTSGRATGPEHKAYH
jgi:hypothetical protein